MVDEADGGAAVGVENFKAAKGLVSSWLLRGPTAQDAFWYIFECIL